MTKKFTGGVLLCFFYLQHHLLPHIDSDKLCRYRSQFWAWCGTSTVPKIDIKRR
jgi:hypothetical protein